MVEEIDLGSPFPIVGYEPRRYETWQDLPEGDNEIEYKFKITVPAGEQYKFHIIVDVTSEP